MNGFYPLVSVIIPNWNTRECILEFLHSLRDQNYPKSAIEVVVVDNGSSDGSVDAIKRWMKAEQEAGWAGLKCIRLDRNYGIAAGYNIGYENCRKDAWAILRGESDIELIPDCLPKLVQALVDMNDVGLVGARGVRCDAHDEVDNDARYMNWWTGSLCNKTPSQRTDCDCVFGGTLLVRAACLKRMGVFFPGDRFLASELELCTRIKRLNYRVLCEPEAVALHKTARTSGQLHSWKFSYISTKEAILFQFGYNRFPFLMVFMGYTLVRGTWRLLKGDSVPLRAFHDSLFHAWLGIDLALPGRRRGDAPMSIPDWLAQTEV